MRTVIKRSAMWLYNRRLISNRAAGWIFSILGLRSA